MRTTRQSFIAIKLLSLLVTLTLTVADIVAKERAGKAAKSAASAELQCKVTTGATGKLVTITNHSDHALAAGTSVSFGSETGVNRKISLQSDLAPGEMAIVHAGYFLGYGCRCHSSR